MDESAAGKNEGGMGRFMRQNGTKKQALSVRPTDHGHRVAGARASVDLRR